MNPSGRADILPQNAADVRSVRVQLAARLRRSVAQGIVSEPAKRDKRRFCGTVTGETALEDSKGPFDGGLAVEPFPSKTVQTRPQRHHFHCLRKRSPRWGTFRAKSRRRQQKNSRQTGWARAFSKAFWAKFIFPIWRNCAGKEATPRVCWESIPP